MQMNMVNILSIQIIQKLHLTGLELGVLSSYYFFANALTFLFAGMLLDKFSTRVMMTFAVGICLLGIIIFFMAHSLLFAKLGRAMMGMSNAICYLSCMKLAMTWFTLSEFSLVIALMGVMAMLGGITSQAVIEFLLQRFGYNNIGLLNIIIGIIILVMVFRFIIDPHSVIAINITTNLKNIITNKTNWLLALIASLLCLPIFIFTALWGKIFLTQYHHVNDTQAAIITSMIFIGHIIGSPCFGWLALQRNKFQLLRQASFLSLLIVLPIIYLQHISFINLCLLLLLLGATTSAQILTYALVVEESTSTQITCLGFMASLIILFGAVLQVIFSWLLQIYNPLNMLEHSAQQYQLALIIFPIGFILCVILSLFHLTEKELI
jgi:MFS family permease